MGAPRIRGSAGLGGDAGGPRPAATGGTGRAGRSATTVPDGGADGHAGVADDPAVTHARADPDTRLSGVSAHHFSWYLATTGSLLVVGLVTNGLAGPAGSVEVTANLFDGGGRLLASGAGVSELAAIASGGSSPFRVVLPGPLAGVSAVTVVVTGYDPAPSTAPVSGLALSVSDIYRDGGGVVHVVGTVVNESSNPWRFVRPIGAFVDAEGVVTRVALAFTAPDTLEPGDAGSFDMLFPAAPAGLEGQDFVGWVDAGE